MDAVAIEAGGDFFKQASTARTKLEPRPESLTAVVGYRIANNSCGSEE